MLTLHRIRPPTKNHCNHYARLVLLLMVLVASTVAQAGLKRIDPGESFELKAGQALVLVVIESDTKLRSVRLSKDGRFLGSKLMNQLPIGRSYALYRADAGSYQWSEIRPFSNWRFRLSDNPEFRFEVNAGQINYPGDLLYQATSLWGAQMRTANRGLQAMDWLQKEFPELHEAHEFHYTGHYPDPFPAYYRAALAEHAKSVPATGEDLLEPAEPTELALSPELLWQRQAFLSATISPDGRFIAVELQPQDELWQIDLIDLKQSTRRVVASSGGPYAAIAWSGNNRLIMEAGPHGTRIIEMLRITPADEGEHAYVAVRMPRKGIVVDPLPDAPDHILFASYSIRRGELLVHRVDMSSQSKADGFRGALSKRLNKGVKNDIDWLTDGKGRLRLAVVYGDDGDTLMYGMDGEFSEIAALEDLPGFQPLHLSYEGDLIYGLSDHERGQRDLVVYDIDRRQFTQTLFSRAGVDVVTTIEDLNRVPVAVVYYDQGQRKTEYFARDAQQSQRQFQRAFPGKSTRLLARSADGLQQLHVVDGGDQPEQLFHFDAPAHNAALLFDLSPQLAETPFAPTHSLQVEVAENLQVDAFLTLPPGAGKRALIVFPHGGPIGVADTQHFSAEVQFLASLGYAVLRINFRGSDGYGRAFREAGHRNWGTLIEDDIDTAIKQAIAEYPIDSERMCMLGSSYGGYSALIAAVRWPDRFRCAVSIAGVSDRLFHFTATDSARTEELRSKLEEIIGSPLSDYQALHAASPIYQYTALTTPLLLAHGLKDQRVDPENTFRLARLLKLAGRPASGIVFAEEAHGIAEPKNQHLLWRAIAAFLQQHLDE